VPGVGVFFCVVVMVVSVYLLRDCWGSFFKISRGGFAFFRVSRFSLICVLFAS